MKTLKVIAWVLVSIVALCAFLKIFIIPDRLSPLTTHVREKDTYYFHTGYPKDFLLAVVKGNTCGDLQGNIAMDSRRRGGARGDQFRWTLDWRQMLGGEIARVEEWKAERHDFSETWSCLPYVDNIKTYLENPDAELEWKGITLKNGPMLVMRGEVISPHDVRVEKVAPCGKHANILCAQVIIKGKAGEYRIVCWSCDRMKEPSSLSRSIIARAVTGGINHGDEYILDGGYMVSESTFGPKQHGFPKGHDPESLFYEETRPGEFAAGRWRHVLRLIDEGSHSLH